MLSRCPKNCFPFQSTSPVRGTTWVLRLPLPGRSISIHVPREGDDLDELEKMVLEDDISIHVPREGDDRRYKGGEIRLRAFQSTSPVRGTTADGPKAGLCAPDFNPRPP